MKFYLPIHESIRTRMNNVNDVLEHFYPSHRSPKATPYGFRLSTSRSIHHRAMLSGKFEPDEVAVVQQFLNQADVFVDVGANIGFYTCLAKAKEKHVVAFEPLNRNLDYLYTNLSTNGWEDVEVFPLGLSAHPGLLTLYSASGTAASLVPGWGRFSKRFRETIPVSTLDIVLGDRFDGRRMFFKIDVEGAEYEVLLGATHFLKMIPKPNWLIEICLDEHHPHGMNPHFVETFELFWKNNYLIKSASDIQRIITRADVERWLHNGKTDVKTFNYLVVSVA